MICVRRCQIIKRAQLQGQTTEGTITTAEGAEYINTGSPAVQWDVCHVDKLIMMTFDSTGTYKMKLSFGAIQASTADKLLNFGLAH